MNKPYTYYLYHIPTGKKYYGARWANKCEPEQDLWDKYFSSSDLVEELIKQYGKDSFRVFVQKIFDTPEDARYWENRVLHKLKAVEKKDWLNQAYACGPFYRQGPQTPEHIEKRSCKLRGKSTSLKGKAQSPEHIEKRRIALLGNTNGKGTIAWNKGVPMKPDAIEAQRIRMKGNTYSKNLKHTSEHKEKTRKTMLIEWQKRKEAGFVPLTGKEHANYGRQWYNDGNRNCLLFNTDIRTKELKKGMIPKPSKTP